MNTACEIKNKTQMNKKRPVKTAFIQLNDKPRLLEVGVFKMVETIQTKFLKIVKSIKEKIQKMFYKTLINKLTNYLTSLKMI